MRKLFILAFCLAYLSFSAQKVYQPNWSSLDQRPTPEWWQDAKFGIFIHWGVYSVPAFTPKGRYAEWYQNSLQQNDPDGSLAAFHQINFGTRTYYDLADDFHAELFNADDWANLFQYAGAKYVVLTSKHHDGFCLWPSEEANRSWGIPWNAGARGPRRDLVGELFTALRKTSVKPGLYYSLYEWYNPLWRYDQRRYAEEHMLPQLYELVQNYQPWVLWADGDWDAAPETWQSPQFLSWLYTQSPVRDYVAVNDRWGAGVRFNHGGFYTPEYQPDVDFPDHAWEESRGIGYSYGYNRAEDAWDYNSAQSLVLQLIDKVSRGGNFLLDIGPDAHGQIPPIMQERLIEMGKWLSANGEAIYGTRRWRNDCQWSAGNRNFTPELIDKWKAGGDLILKQTVNPDPGFAVKEVFFTWNPKQNAVYAILPKYPADRKVVLRGVQLPANTEVTLLATKEKLRIEAQQGGNTVIYLPEYNPSKFTTDYAFALKINNYGNYIARPVIDLHYNPLSMQATMDIKSSTPGATIRYTTDGSEPRENSNLFSATVPVSGSGLIRAKAFKTGVLPSGEDSVRVKSYRMQPSLSMLREPAPGLRAQVLTAAKYNSSTLQRDGKTEREYEAFDFTLDPLCTTDRCGMIWTGYIKVARTGGYEFSLESDDGSLLYVDNELVVNNDGDHSNQAKNGMALLQQGWHGVKLVYFNSGGAANLKVRHGSVGSALQEFLPAQLAH